MTIFETLSLIIAAVSVAALLLQLHIGVRTMRADHERRKKQATLEFVMSHVRPLWTEGQRILDERWGAGVLSEQALKDIQEDTKAREIVKTLLGHLEHMSVGLNTGIYDKDLLFRASGAYLIRLFHRLRPYVKYAQKSLPTAYVEFENLVRDFEERKRLKPPTEGNIIHS